MVNTNLYNTLRGIQKGGTANVSVLLFEKKDLLVKTFANLIVQTMITYYAMKKYSKEKKNRFVSILVLIYVFAFILILALIPIPIWLKLMMFSVFSYGWGYYLSGLMEKVGEDVIHHAMIGTLGIFVTMFAIGLFMLISGIRLGIRTGLFLFFSLFGLILGTLFSSSSIWTMVGIVIFAMYILYDTNNILQKNYYGDFVTASIDYYLDIF